MANRPPNSYDVAKAAGLSQSALSRAFSPGRRIAEKTLSKIFKVAQELGYKPNAIARSLISKRSNIIGIVMADVVNPFYPAVLDIFMRKLQQRGHKGMLFIIHKDEQVDDVLAQLLD